MVDSDAGFRAALEGLIASRGARLVRSLGRRFPGVPAPRVEEAAQEVFADACDPERGAWFIEGFNAGGEDELYRRLFTAGWRQLRGDLRRVGERRTDRLVTGFERAGVVQTDPVEREELSAWMRSRVQEAARSFGRARHTTLVGALESLISGGRQVKTIAEDRRLPRRYLAEASVWLRRRLQQRASDEDAPR